LRRNVACVSVAPRLGSIQLASSPTAQRPVHHPRRLGAIAGARNSIGITLVTGMVIGTAFTLLVVPSIYTLLARSHAAATEQAIGGLAAAEA